MAGSLPFWIFNVQHPLASLGIGGARQTSWLSDFANIFGTAIPIILGARPNWGGSASDYFPLSGLLATSAFLICVIREIRGPNISLEPPSRSLCALPPRLDSARGQSGRQFVTGHYSLHPLQLLASLTV